MFLNANRGVREIRLLLKNVVDEELERSAKSTLRGVGTERLLVHGFALQTGEPEGQDKQSGKTARWELDGFMRHAMLDLCAASKVADYMLVRFKDLPLQPALASAEALLAFLDLKVFMRHTKNKPPHAYHDNTIKMIKHGAVRSHIDSLGSEEEARRYAKHSGKVHEASYSNRTWVPKLAMAKVAGHRDGFVQLYCAGIWCSIEQDAAFKALFDRITPVTDEQLAEAEALMEGRREWAGVRAMLIALRNYTDVIPQDLGKAAALRAADGGTAVQVPQTPPGLPLVQQLSPVEQLTPVQQLPANPAAIVDLIQEVPGALAAPGGGWTPAALYARYSDPLKAGVPSLREVMVQQGHLDWARPGKDRKAAVMRLGLLPLYGATLLLGIVHNSTIGDSVRATILTLYGSPGRLPN
ncbi:g2371 [Coccomyxa elongata]